MQPRLSSQLLQKDPPAIWVIGDVMLDRYMLGTVERVSPEAPVPVLALCRIEDKVGGAANVAQNLLALGAQVALAGRIGSDEPAAALRSLLARAGVAITGLLTEPDAVTTVKQRALAGQQQLLRIDHERIAPLAPASIETMLDALAQDLPTPRVIIVSDYGKGVVSQSLIESLTQRHPGVPLFVDPKGRDYAKYRGAALITPNEHEAALASGVAISDAVTLEKAAHRLSQILPGTAILITRGARGMALHLPASPTQPSSVVYSPAQARQVYDVTGAGDTALAALAIGWTAALPWEDTLHIANLAAGIKVGRVGAVPIALSEVLAALSHEQEGKLVQRSDLAALRRRTAEAGQRLVFTNGCFDVLHIGHLRSLQQARQQGDLLLVALNSDASVKRLKGPSRPLNTEADRATLLAGLACVDFVTLFEEDTPLETLRACRPDVLVKGGDYTLDRIVGAQDVLSWGGRVEIIPLVAGQSSTRLINELGHAPNPLAPHDPTMQKTAPPC